MKALVKDQQVSFTVDPQKHEWHDSLIGLNEKCTAMFVANKKVFMDGMDVLKISELEIEPEEIMAKVDDVIELPDLGLPKEPKIEASLPFSSDLVSLIIAENRLQNTEMRMALTKLNEKLDKLTLPSSSIDVDAQIKKVMNKMFRQLRSQINVEQTYQGHEVLQIVANCLKSSSEYILRNTK